MARRVAADVAQHLGFHLLAPARPSGALPMELEALLPNRRHNDDLLAGLAPLLSEAGARGGAIAAVFAADPFINVREMTSALAKVGIVRVANFPSVAQYGKAFEQSLSEVGLGVQRELAILAEFRKYGFKTYLTLAEHPHAAFDVESHAGVLIAISFDDMQGATARDEILSLRRRWARSRVGAGQSTLICRPPEREAVESDGRSTVIWPLD